MAISRFVNFNLFLNLLSVLFIGLPPSSALAEIVIDSGDKKSSSTPILQNHPSSKSMPGIVMDYQAIQGIPANPVMIIENNAEYNIYRSRQWAEKNNKTSPQHMPQSIVFYSNMTPVQKNVLRARYYANKK